MIVPSSGDSPRHGPPRRPGAPPRPLARLPQRPDASHPRPPQQRVAAVAPPQTAPATPRVGPFTSFVRYGLPATVVLAGVIAMCFGTDTSLEGGAGLVSAGLSIWFVNWLFRIGASGDEERDAEDRAREYYDQHGRWPDGG